MFGRRPNSNSSNRSKSNNTKKNRSQFAFMDIPDLTNIGNLDNVENFGSDDDDDDLLEAELLALTSGDVSKPKKQPRPLVNQSDLDRMIQESLRDIPSDEDVSSGEEDPAVLAELQGLQVDSGPSVDHEIQPHTENSSSDPLKSILQERLKMYETAEENAKNLDDSSKARRMTRGVSTLRDLIKQVNAGRRINEEDIPPVVSIAVPKSNVSTISTETQISVVKENNIDPILLADSLPPPIPPRISKHSLPFSEDTSEEPQSKIKPTMDNVQDGLSPVFKNSAPARDSAINVIIQRQDEYKKAAVEAKKANDIQTALSYVRIVKQLDTILNEAKEGAIIDISTLSPPLQSSPNEISISPKISISLKRQDSEKQTSSSPINSVELFEIRQTQPSSSVPVTYNEPKTVMEALEQRLAKFKESEEAAKKENNSSKMRRMVRIVKQYEDAIKLHKSGKPIPVDELPTPPGFAPIPVEGATKLPSQPVPKMSPVSPVTDVKPAVKTLDKQASRMAIPQNEKQLRILLEKQKLFKLAALKAKQNGDLDAAKEYLKSAKGFDSMIEASKGGLPVDLNSLPLPPDEKSYLETGHEVVKSNDSIKGSDTDIFTKLQTELQNQIQMCFETRDNFKAIGDIANANRLDQLALQSKKDLQFVQLAESSNLRVPKFHYETKQFSIVQCNTDLTDNDVEVTVIQGINYNVPNPKEIDTYVKLYFPYPAENSQQHKSATIYNTNNPVYDTTVIFNMQRNVRACQRIFKRQTLKCEIWSKGGLFRSDSLVGQANVKLQPLEAQCTLHDAYDLMDGRRTVGGKVEIKIRIRDPILRKQINHVEEKWLIIDS